MVCYENLLRLPAYGVEKSIKKEFFLNAMQEAFEFQMRFCKPFQSYIKRRGIDEAYKFSCIEDFPYLPVQAFKEFGKYLVTSQGVSNERVFMLESSSTSGRPSTINVDRTTAKRQTQLMTRTLANFLGNKKIRFIVVDIDPANTDKIILGARFAATLGFLNFANSVTYVLTEDSNGQLKLDIDKFLSELHSAHDSGEQFVVFGFTYMLYQFILGDRRFKKIASKNKNGFLLHIGGWKKLESQKIDRQEFNRLCEDIVGINQEKVIDVYGFTEQMGLIYPSFGIGNKICSTYSDVLVRDPVTLRILPHGSEGVLQFLSPMPYSYPGLSILTDDLGMICEDEVVNGVLHKAFKITGRTKKAEVRGCGDVMSSYVRPNFISDTTASNESISDELDSPVKLLWADNFQLPIEEYLSGADSNKFKTIDSLEAISNKLKVARHSLDKYTSDELISYLSHISKTWLTEESPLSKFKNEGLTFLSSWLNSFRMREIFDLSFNGQRDIIEKFKVDRVNPLRSIRAFPRGTVGHWLAGNVPLLGMLALAQSIVTKNANIIKAPAQNSGILPAMLTSMANCNLTLTSGRVILGKDIVSSIAVIYYPRTNFKAATQLSKISDLRIAWGGSEAIASVMSLPKKHTTEDVIFGPKLSYMVVGQEVLSHDSNVRKLAKRIAIDCSVFDQYACASPHTLFVERGGALSPKEFANLIADEMGKVSLRIPKNPPDGGTIGKIQSKRMLYEFTQTVWSSKDTTWTVLYDDNGHEGLVDPTYSRVITIRAIDNIMDAASFATPDIQTIALGLSSQRQREFANRAAPNGVSRFPDIGRMTHFDTPWDGLILMQRLVRFVSLGGPVT